MDRHESMMAFLAQGVININEGLTTVEENSAVHEAMKHFLEPLYDAAPELLDACKELLQVVGRSGWLNITPIPSEKAERVRLLNATRKAIAKAEGAE